MPKINHYSVLGLDPSGKKEGQFFTTEEITKAYRALALKLHPDKETGSTEAFQALGASYEILSNDNKREEFNRNMQETPEAFAPPVERQDLYAHMSGEESDPIPVDESPYPLVVQTAKGINLTVLLETAETSCAEKIAFAREDANIAFAFAQNDHIFHAFSYQEKFELLLILVSTHDVEMARLQSRFNLFFSASPHSHEARAMVHACDHEQALATQLFRTYQDYFKTIHLNTLLLLQSFDDIARILIECHEHELSLTIRTKLRRRLALPAPTLTRDQRAQQQLIRRFKKACDNNTLALPLMLEVVNALGIKTFEYCNSLEQNMLAIQAIIENDARFDYFNADDTRLRLKGIKVLSARDIHALIQHVTFLKFESYPCDLLQHTAFFEKILLRAKSGQIVQFYSSLPGLDGKSYSVFYAGLIGQITGGKDLLIHMIISEAIPFILGNQALLNIVLTDEHYLAEMESGHNDFRKCIARLVAIYNTSIDLTASMSAYPNAIKCVEAYKTFFNVYLKPKAEIPDEEFDKLFRETGFFPEMFHIEKPSIPVMSSILTNAGTFLEERSRRTDYKDKIQSFFYTVITQGNELQAAKLFRFYKECPFPEIFPSFEFDSNNARQRFDLFCKLALNPQWSRAITGQLLKQWHDNARGSALKDLLKQEGNQKKLQHYNQLTVLMNYFSEKHFTTLFRLLSICGLDLKTQSLFQNTMKPSDYDLFLFLAPGQTDIPFHPHYICPSTPHQEALLLAQRSSLAAKHYLKINHATIDANALFLIHEKYGDDIRDLIATHGLQKKLDGHRNLTQFMGRTKTTQPNLFSAAPKDTEETIRGIFDKLVKLIRMSVASEPFETAYLTFTIQLTAFLHKNETQYPRLKGLCELLQQRDVSHENILDTSFFALRHAIESESASASRLSLESPRGTAYQGLFNVVSQSSMTYRELVQLFNASDLEVAITEYLNQNAYSTPFVFNYVTSLLTTAEWTFRDITEERIKKIIFLEAKTSECPVLRTIPVTPKLFDLDQEKLILLPWFTTGAWSAQEIHRLSLGEERLCVAGLSFFEKARAYAAQFKELCASNDIAILTRLSPDLFKLFAGCFFERLGNTKPEALLALSYVDLLCQDERTAEQRQIISGSLPFKSLISSHSLFMLSDAFVSTLISSSRFSIEEIQTYFTHDIAKDVLYKTMRSALSTNNPESVQLRKISAHPEILMEYFNGKNITYPAVDCLFEGQLENILDAYIKHKAPRSVTNHADLLTYIYERLNRNEMTWGDCFNLTGLDLTNLAVCLKAGPSAMHVSNHRELLELNLDKPKLSLLLNHGFSAENINHMTRFWHSVCLKICENHTSFESHPIHPLTKIKALFKSSYWSHRYYERHNAVDRVYDFIIQEPISDESIFLFHLRTQPFQLNTADFPSLFFKEKLSLSQATVKIIDLLLAAVDHSASETLRPAACPRDPEILLNAQAARRRDLQSQQTLRISANFNWIEKAFAHSTLKSVAQRMDFDSLVNHLEDLSNLSIKNEILSYAIMRLIRSTAHHSSTPFKIAYLQELLQTHQLTAAEVCELMASEEGYGYLEQLETDCCDIEALRGMRPTKDLFALRDRDRIPLLRFTTDSFTVDHINALQQNEVEFGRFLLLAPYQTIPSGAAGLALGRIVDAFGRAILERIPNIHLQNTEKQFIFSNWVNQLTVGAFLELKPNHINSLRRWVPFLDFVRRDFCITTPDNDVFKLNQSHDRLFQLLANGFMTAQQINALETHSLAFKIHESIALKGTIDLKMHARIRTFCDSAYYTFLVDDILTPMQMKLAVLQNTENAVDKANLMQHYIERVLRSTIEIVCDEQYADWHQDNLIRMLHDDLKHTIADALDEPNLKMHHDPIRKFFLKLLGVILAGCCLFLPLLSQRYRQTFFADSPEIQLMKRLQQTEAEREEPQNNR